MHAYVKLNVMFGFVAGVVREIDVTKTSSMGLILARSECFQHA